MVYEGILAIYKGQRSVKNGDSGTHLALNLSLGVVPTCDKGGPADQQRTIFQETMLRDSDTWKGKSGFYLSSSQFFQRDRGFRSKNNETGRIHYSFFIRFKSINTPE